MTAKDSTSTMVLIPASIDVGIPNKLSLTSKAILGALHKETDGAFWSGEPVQVGARALAHRIGSPYVSVRRALREMEALGVLDCSGWGKKCVVALSTDRIQRSRAIRRRRAPSESGNVVTRPSETPGISIRRRRATGVAG